MKLASKKTRISNFLKKNGYKQSESYPSRVKGYPNVNHGFKFKKWDDDTFLLYFENGNFGFRDLPLSKINDTTKEYYDLILNECNLENISLSVGWYYNGVLCIEIR